MIRNRNFQRDVTAWTGWQRSHHYHPRLTRQKRCFDKCQVVTHPITGFKDDSACVTTKTAGRIAEDGLVVQNIIYMVYNIFRALTL